jgi:hypothetical protein
MQVIGYVICRHNHLATTLGDLITTAIDAVTQAGLVVKVCVMDQESTHWKWIKDQNVTPFRPFIMHKGEKVYILPDPPHLIKSLRTISFPKTSSSRSMENSTLPIGHM